MPTPKVDRSLFSNQDGIHHDVPMYDPYQNQHQPMMINSNDPNIPPAANYWIVGPQSQDILYNQYPPGGIGQLAYHNPILPPMQQQQQQQLQMPPPQPPPPPMMPPQYPPPAYPPMPYPQAPPQMYPPAYPTPQYYPVPYPGGTPQIIPQPYPVFITK